MRNPLETDWWRGFYGKHRRKLFVVQAMAFVMLGVVVVGVLWRSPAEPQATGTEAPVTTDVAGETLWTCSMHPQIRQPKPGDCPICGMDLIPVVKSAGGMRTLAVSAESKALMSIETSPVERRYVMHEIRMVGRVDYDETKLGYITAWVPGRLDRLYVDFTGIEVKKGDHLASLYSEQLYSIQEELIQALKYRSERPATTTTRLPSIDLAESARERLRLLGLKEEQIAEIEKRDQPEERMTIYAPLGGIVIEKLKQQGERVQLGERIYTIADLSQLWVHLDAYESDLPWVRYGQEVTITTEAYPGEAFHGRIAFIQPVLDDRTRTVKVRVNVPNPHGKLKPDMFVSSVVRSRVAAGGKVMDPSLAGKWISPMHPEIVKDEPGACDVCGMPLVRAESLGYVTPDSDKRGAPLVIPYSAALVTGTRAIVYAQLPNMPSAAEAAFQTLSVVVQQGDLPKIREAFASYANMLDQPYDQPGTGYARSLWNQYADTLSQHALAGQRATSAKEAELMFAKIEATMNEAREQFAPSDRPTFEGREIVLGSRAGDYYLVAHGLEEGELVVTRGNFKIDAEIQIQAKPSMMTPEGGGGGGHDHGGGGAAAKKTGGDEHAQHQAALPADFTKQIQRLEDAYAQVAEAVQQQDVGQATAAFTQVGQALNDVDGSVLTGHPRMQWKEFAMLLGNDAAEGRAAQQIAEADRVFLLLKGHMRRMREQLGVVAEEETHLERIVVSPAFRSDLARVWEQYLALGQALAADNLQDAQKVLPGFESAVAAIDDKTLDSRAKAVWSSERTNLVKLIGSLKNSQEIKALRAQFLPLSQEIGVLAKTFGFSKRGPIYELHCPMAFQGKGAVWYQDSDQVRNPYFGSTMLTCADRVDRIAQDEPPALEQQESHGDHSQH
ncbi:MAG: efflux RND transporter periplasmic adaptor subunit [Pirellulaceae bacterium]|nr:efflux RND transporter periplasmic adaptor subunit [Pirellulaceae bacterium]